MSSNGNRKRSKSRSDSRSRDKRDKSRSSYQSNDYKDKSSYNKNKIRKSSEEGVKLYISNLGSNVTERRVLDEFKHYGEVIDYSIKRKNGKSNFFGYVVMKSRSAGEKAMNHINKSLGWRVTLYDKDEKRDRYRDKSRSYSRSRSRSHHRNESASHAEEDKRQTAENEQEKRVDESKPVRVREIWVGNLPNGISESTLYNNFFIYGEIAKIETHFQHDKNFAFIKYRQQAAASRAYEKGKNMNLNGNVIRVSFSDSGKRRDIIGDEPGYELNEKTCKLLHLSLNKGSNVASESVLRDLFKKYGAIKGLHIKNTPGFRPTIYLEYSKPEEAENALNNLTTLDTNEEKRKLIGDPKCDINYYFKKKFNPMMMNNDINNMNRNNFQNFGMNVNNPNMKMMYPFMGMNPMMNQQMRFFPRPMINQQFNPNTGSNPMGNNSMMGSTNPSSLNTSVSETHSNQNQSFSNTGTNPNFSQQNYPYTNQGSMDNMGTIPPMMQRYPFNMNQMNRPMMFPNNPMYSMMYNNSQQAQQQNQPDQNQNVKDLIENALNIIKNNQTNQPISNQDEEDISSIAEDSSNVFEKEYSLEEENLKNIWGGFLTKNKKDRVCVDAYQIRNECSDYLNNEYNLNVSHRTPFEDIVKRPIIGIIAFSPQNATQCETFQEYINYFNDKNRVGLINLKNQMILYLIPPSDFSRKFYQNPKKHLLGIFVDSKVEPKPYVDMNNLSLPPPVISLTEKRLILKQNKKTSTTANQSLNANLGVTSPVNAEKSGTNELSKLLGIEQDKLDLIFKAAAEAQNTQSSSSNINPNDLAQLLSNPQIKNLLQMQLNQLNK